MKRISLHINIISLLICGILFTGGCKRKKEIVPPFVKMTLEVKDENKVPVKNASAFLYDNRENYDKAIQNSLKGIYNNTGCFRTGNVLDGVLSFSLIPSGQDYWVLVHDDSRVFTDKGVTTGIRIHRDNSLANYYVPAYREGTEIFATVRLEPVNALLKLEAPAGTVIQNAPEIGNRYDSTSVSFGSYINVRKGKVPFYVRNDYCVWSGSAEAAGGLVTTYRLDQCSQAGITFILAGNLDSDSVTVYIGQNKSVPVAVLNADRKQQTIYLSANQTSYTYFAQSSRNKCVWQGVLVVNAGGLVTCVLDPCP